MTLDHFYEVEMTEFNQYFTDKTPGYKAYVSPSETEVPDELEFKLEYVSHEKATQAVPKIKEYFESR